MRLVLCGIGHAHLPLAASCPDLIEAGIEPVFVSPGPLHYSGMAGGVIGGRHRVEDATIDAESAIERGGGTFLRDRCSGLDLDRGLVLLESGGALPFDAVSFNVGSEARGLEPLPGNAVPCKPLRGPIDLAAELAERRTAARVAVIGGGATGCEIAANLQLRAPSAGVVLLAGGARLSVGGPLCARSAARSLRALGVEVRTGARVVRLLDSAAVLSSGEEVPFDRAVLATGLRPVRLMQRLGLPTGPRGGLLVDATLRSVADARVFAAGDCAEIRDRDLPRLGVFGVRQAPILLRNVLALATCASGKSYSPQRLRLEILNLGRWGLARWGPLFLCARGCLAWKDYLDRTWVERSRRALAAGRRTPRIGTCSP
ncbi:MAG: FAD-dependent oxidoreductase [Planctomycetota bacterium]